MKFVRYCQLNSGQGATLAPQAPWLAPGWLTLRLTAAVSGAVVATVNWGGCGVLVTGRRVRGGGVGAGVRVGCGGWPVKRWRAAYLRVRRLR